MYAINIITAICFGVLCCAIGVRHAQLSNRVTMLDMTLLSAGGIFGFALAGVLSATAAGLNEHWAPFIDPTSPVWLLHTLCALLAVGSIVAGWVVTRRGLGAIEISSARRSSSGTGRLAIALWSLLVLSVVLELIYMSPYGGLIKGLQYSKFIRYGIFQVHNPFTLLSAFTHIALFSALGFFGSALTNKTSEATWIGFCLAFSFSIYLLYSWLGRVDFVVFISSFLFGIVLYRSKSTISVLLYAVLASVLVVLISYVVSVALNFKETHSLLTFLSLELSFPFGGFGAWIKAGSPWRWFADILMIPAYALPQSIWMRFFTPITDLTTTLISGAPKGTNGVTGGIPEDIITLGYTQLSYAGIAVVCFLFGVFIAAVQFILDGIEHKGVRSALSAYVYLKIGLLGILYSTPYLFFSSNIGLIIFVVVIFLVQGGTVARRAHRSEAVLS